MKKTLLLSAAIVAAFSAFAQDNVYLESDYYVIGSNVNGKSWSLAQEDCKFESKGGGIFEWNGEYLGTGFKINDGTWDNNDLNFGAGELLVLGENYYCVAAGSSGNIAFAESEGVSFSGLNNPKVVLNVANAPEEIIIVVTGEKTGVIKWYITGTFNDWKIDEDEAAIELEDLGGKKYEAKGVEFTEDTITEDGYNTFKISSTGWADQFGQGDSGIEFGAGVDEGVLDIVGGEGGACPFYGIGKYDVEWDGNSHYIKFTESAGDFVNEIVAANGQAVYYNLQGARVSEPTNGIFIQTLNGKSSKVLIRK